MDGIVGVGAIVLLPNSLEKRFPVCCVRGSRGGDDDDVGIAAASAAADDSVGNDSGSSY